MKLLAPALATTLSLVLPPRCPGCGGIVGADHRFCAGCWSSLHFLAGPGCAACGLPWETDRGGGAVCDSCAARPPAHAGIHAAVAYGEVARAVALGLKYGGRIALAQTMARLMRRGLPAADVIVPVPLHRWRLWSRGFNQAGLIADALGKGSSIPVERRALIRPRATAALRGLGRGARAEEVGTAFAVDPARRDAVAGRRLVLVDDVYTSGATAGACVRALLGAGARSVAIACWARVVDDGPAD